MHCIISSSNIIRKKYFESITLVPNRHANKSTLFCIEDTALLLAQATLLLDQQKFY